MKKIEDSNGTSACTCILIETVSMAANAGVESRRFGAPTSKPDLSL